jgi:hypothetical protein
MVDYKCIKCDKIFNSPSKLERHKNNKIPCNKVKEELFCECCNIKFTRPSHKTIHEKTKKHITNYNQSNINGDNINQIGNNNSINFQNIINLTLQTKPFSETDTQYLRKWIIDDIGNDLYIKTMDRNYCTVEKIKSLFRGTVEILEHLHFNLNNEDNHNLKILLMFPGFKKPLYEYLILEIEPDTNKITWNSLTYDKFIIELFNHLSRMNDNVNNENFEKYIYFLKKYLIHDEEVKEEIKPYIENTLNDLYINFNTKQKKDIRPVKITLEEKIKEYVDYRNQETRLHNGFNPNIINSQI